MPPASMADIFEHSSHWMEGDVGSPQRKLVECRICHDEDEHLNMETPCSCCGSLKQYRPGYMAPPPLYHYGVDHLNFGIVISTQRELGDFRERLASCRHSHELLVYIDLVESASHWKEEVNIQYSNCPCGSRKLPGNVSDDGCSTSTAAVIVMILDQMNKRKFVVYQNGILLL
ncbi:Eukaryotic translation initiation factor 5 isoform 1 [Hibiscus syriacus]|uniref:Eukaryotic translation initiation factor 5 isoform 1 n=1 Tax=Hibiscus syriacus TaxID=106335 RepID=A0A6A2ZXC8_HIBSY|nr:Eukaryotic translation initiation factor 5 isoform 1 [Hibiscus syriacus]